MISKFKIKKFFGFYKNKSSVWIRVIQTDDVEYTYEVNINQVDDEIKRMKPLVKEIEVC